MQKLKVGLQTYIKFDSVRYTMALRPAIPAIPANVDTVREIPHEMSTTYQQFSLKTCPSIDRSALEIQSQKTHAVEGLQTFNLPSHVPGKQAAPDERRQAVETQPLALHKLMRGF